MPRAKIIFHSLVQNSQDYESFDKREDHMVSLIKFSIEVGGKTYPNMKVELRQPYGTDYETEPLEVGGPKGPYKGSWNHTAFADLCEKYYRSFVGSSGSGIRIAGGSNIRMRDNQFFSKMIAEFDIPEAGSDAW